VASGDPAPTLLVMAAGLGSRYGGLKQIDRFGPGGETIMDYAVFDALAAGFGKVVFIIRRDFEAEFRAVVAGKYEVRLAVDYVFQELGDLPAGFAAPPGRTKPWGTVHAVWCARNVVREPFACVNADDFYGRSAYETVARHLRRPSPAAAAPEYCIVGYPILQTLSDHGGVVRAICEMDADGCLVRLAERTGILRKGATGTFVDENGASRTLTGSEVVSMNMMGFSPALFPQLERHLAAFLAAHRAGQAGAECILPVVVGKLVEEKSARVRVLAIPPSGATWFGVTHPDDKPGVTRALQDMVACGTYPSPLWPRGANR
jgi:hypothetical protein